MRFGGHETFPIRTGWLSKGLLLLGNGRNVQFDDPSVADVLGVGRNMSKSIRHWLHVTGLVTRDGRNAPIILTELGRLILSRDPYLQHIATWWALHINLATQTTAAAAWRWFFNDFARERFDRLTCIDEFTRALERKVNRLPSYKTIARDIACLLQSYSTPLPAEPLDPEDATDCPLRMLKLIVQHRDTGYFDRRFIARPIPPELLGYAFAQMQGEDHSGLFEIPFTDALVLQFAPGRVLALDAEGLASLLNDAERVCGREKIRTFLLGGERMIAVVWKSPTSWLADYYERVGG